MKYQIKAWRPGMFKTAFMTEEKMDCIFPFLGIGWWKLRRVFCLNKSIEWICANKPLLLFVASVIERLALTDALKKCSCFLNLYKKLWEKMELFTLPSLSTKHGNLMVSPSLTQSLVLSDKNSGLVWTTFSSELK